ncbi:MAG: phosphoribosylformylglycinamidine synthase, partial [Syntrophales bacterium]|nr:phosphoribosylformylglycinamidine synthase [Syntrophales bacterium]
MLNRIEVGFREGIRDAMGERTGRRITEELGIPVENVKTVEVYTIEGRLTRSELKRIAAGPLSDSIIQKTAVNGGLAGKFDWLIEVGFRPGVTDNVGRTAREAIRLLLEDPDRDISVYTSRQYLIRGALGRDEIEWIASGLLANELIQRF